jgi:hypothetical protein
MPRHSPWLAVVRDESGLTKPGAHSAKGRLVLRSPRRAKDGPSPPAGGQQTQPYASVQQTVSEKCGLGAVAMRQLPKIAKQRALLNVTSLGSTVAPKG